MKSLNLKIRHNLPRAVLVFTLFILIVGCGGDEPTAPSATNQSPTVPAINTLGGAPTDAAADVALTAVLRWTCSDPEDDALAYTVHFGTAADPAVVATDQTVTSYTPPGLTNSTTYFWRIVASDVANNNTASPVWQFTTVAATVAETIDTPATPTGPATGSVGADLTFGTSGATSNLGHTLEYHYDWGDGVISAWATATDATYAWDLTGQYDVKVQARCQINTSVLSDWSTVLPITVTAAAETITAPGGGVGAVGPVNGNIGEDQEFVINWPSVSSEGHVVEHRFSWADGEFSPWSNAMTASHAWSAAGTYVVRIQGRCSIHTNVVSDWADSDPLVITDAAEIVSAPTGIRAPFPLQAFVRDLFVVDGGTSSFGDPVQYRMDWGPDGISDWQSSPIFSFAITVSGPIALRAQARCALHPEVISDWSPTEDVVAAEGNQALPEPTGTNSLIVGESVTFSTIESVNSEGHTLEYNFYFSTPCNSTNFYGPNSGWSTDLSQSFSYDTAGQKGVRVLARCTQHPDVITASPCHLVYVTAP